MILLEKQKTSSLKEVVKETLLNYFLKVGEEEPIDVYSMVLEEVERPLIEVLINYTNDNQVRVAKILGISRGTLRKKLKLYGMLV